MVTWKASLIVAAALVAGGAVYIRLRWSRSPQALRAMIGLTACFFVAGSIVGAWILHLIALPPNAPVAETASTSAGVPSPAVVPVAPTLDSVPPSSKPVIIPPLHYDPAHAVLPDPKLTPGEVFADATKDDVCTPGWAREHRHVTDSDRAKVYAEYPDSARTCLCLGGAGNCCEVDHLIPLELGGSNDLKNLWPEPEEPRPGDGEKDSLENTLHELVCKGEMPLADAQKCIASDWVKCWEKYVVPRYGPEWAARNRHGW
jgi:hypothetical protein